LPPRGEDKAPGLQARPLIATIHACKTKRSRRFVA
jgi:hypothetical protein